MTKEERIEKAVSLFKEGYNCSQSVVTAYADMYGFTREQALHMAASFGGGIGRMRETCGAACGMFCWLDWNVVPLMEQTGKGRRPIMRWYNNWRISLNRSVDLCAVLTCWGCRKRILSYQLQKREPVSITLRGRVPRW